MSEDDHRYVHESHDLGLQVDVTDIGAVLERLDRAGPHGDSPSSRPR